MSGRSGIMPPRSRPAPERPPVESWTITPGQCRRRPSISRPNFSGSEEGVWSSLRTWQWTSVAPASNASCVESTCSAIVIGTAGLSRLVGSEPVIATVMMQGVSMALPRRPHGRGLWRVEIAGRTPAAIPGSGPRDHALPPGGRDAHQAAPYNDLPKGEDMRRTLLLPALAALWLPAAAVAQEPVQPGN